MIQKMVHDGVFFVAECNVIVAITVPLSHNHKPSMQDIFIVLDFLLQIASGA